VRLPRQPCPGPGLHRPRPRVAPAWHRHDAGHHKAQCPEHRHRPHRSRLRRPGQGRPPQSLPHPGPPTEGRGPGNGERRGEW